MAGEKWISGLVQFPQLPVPDWEVKRPKAEWRGFKIGSCELLLTGKAQLWVVKGGCVRSIRDVRRSSEGKPPPSSSKWEQNMM